MHLCTALLKWLQILTTWKVSLVGGVAFHIALHLGKQTHIWVKSLQEIMALPYLDTVNSFVKDYRLSDTIASALRQYGEINRYNARLEELAQGDIKSGPIKSLGLSQQLSNELYNALQEQFMYIKMKAGTLI